jgi:putative RecB family exonuclease
MSIIENISEIVKSKVLLVRPEECESVLSLSVSKTKTFKDCKAKYRFCYLEKLPRKEWDFHVFGKFLHEVLERFYRKILDGNKDLPNVILSVAWKEAYLNWKQKLTALQIAEAKEICNLFLKYLALNNSPPRIISVEEPFFIDIDGKVLLNGFIDRVQIDHDGVLHVSDYKTTKNKRYLKNDYFQLQTYAFVMCLKDPSLKKVRTSYILLRHGFESIVKEFQRDEIMQIEKSFLDYSDQIHAEKLFRPNPTRLCGYCDYLENCDAGQKMMGIDYSLKKFGDDKW